MERIQRQLIGKNTLFLFLTNGKKDGVQIEEEFLNFERGENAPCVLYHKERDLVVLVYVDDILADGREEDIKWFFDKLGDRFDCKDDEWLTPETALDFLGSSQGLGGQCSRAVLC
jgi:hypothetical protein